MRKIQSTKARPRASLAIVSLGGIFAASACVPPEDAAEQSPYAENAGGGLARPASTSLATGASTETPAGAPDPTTRFSEAPAPGLVLAGASRGEAAAPPGGVAPPAAGRKRSMLGYNMDYPGDWTNQPPFIDQMKNARVFRGECSGADAGCDPSRHLDLDAGGWVRSLAYKDEPSRAYTAVNAVVNTSNERADIGQLFVVTWTGRGTVAVQGGADVRLDSAARRLTFRLTDADTVLSIRDIDPADHPRSIRMFRADHEALLDAGEIFNPDLLRFLEPFGSVRFMDWMQSNTAGQCSGGTTPGEDCYAVTTESCGGGGVCLMPGRWQQRPTADQPSYHSAGQYLDPARPELGSKVGGYPVEVLVALANRAAADPHFNMPADYDEEYVRAFAEYVKQNLAPDLTASVEYSNEVWNWGFPQAQYANQLGHEAWPEEGSAWVQYAAGRTNDMCRIWKEVFAGEESRVRCLISPQTTWRDLAETVLECPAWVASHPDGGPCYQYADAINITGYFSGCLHENPEVLQGWLAEGQAAALDRAFEQLEHGGLISGCEDSLDETIDDYGYFAELARQRGLDLYVYESGTHFAYYDDPEVRELLVNVTRDPRMQASYERNFKGFRDEGGGVFNVWGWVAPNDAWANSDSLTDLDHPKYRAIVEFADDAPLAAP